MKKVFILLIVLIIIGGGVYYYLSTQKAEPDSRPGLKINPEELIVFEVKKENMSEYQKDNAFQLFTNAKNIISSNKESGYDNEDDANYYAWLEIASAQKLIGDYERVEKLWLWFTEVYPGNSISPANLGDFYKSFVVDREKSEKYYQIALEREEHDFQIYYGFYELYRYVFEDEDKAIAVLEDGIKNNPDSKNYVNELVSYLLEIDRKQKASEVIEAWIENHPEDYSMRVKLEG